MVSDSYGIYPPATSKNKLVKAIVTVTSDKVTPLHLHMLTSNGSTFKEVSVRSVASGVLGEELSLAINEDGTRVAIAMLKTDKDTQTKTVQVNLYHFVHSVSLCSMLVKHYECCSVDSTEDDESLRAFLDSLARASVVSTGLEV